MTDQITILLAGVLFGAGLAISERILRCRIYCQHIKWLDGIIERLASDLTFECQQTESLRNSRKELLANFIHQNRVIMRMRKEKADGK